MITSPRLTEQWHSIAAYLDGRNQRERVLLLLTAIAMVYFLYHVALFRPLLNFGNSIQEKSALNQTHLALLQDQARDMLDKIQTDPDAANRARLAELTRQLSEVEAPVTELMRSLVSPREMTKLVKTVLSRRHNLALVTVENLPPEVLSLPGAAQDDKPANGDAPLYKHGIRIVVQGGFRDILGFLNDLEKMSWKVLWDQADIKSEDYPVSTAELTVYTLSTDKSWIGL